MELGSLADDALLDRVRTIRADARQLDVALVCCLAEVEARRLHLRLGFSSLFDYCTHGVGMSEGSAFRRIVAARMLRKHARLESLVLSGRLHLSTLVMLRDHIDEANLDELVQAVAGRTTKEAAAILARRAPRPDVRGRIRKLPPPQRPAEVTTESAPLPHASEEQAQTAEQPGRAPAVVAAIEVPSTASTEHICKKAPSTPISVAPTHAARGETAATRPHVEPLSDDRYKMQLTIDGALRKKIDRARDLMRHRNPSGDLATIVDAAVDALLAKLERERLGTAKHPRPAPIAETTAKCHIPTAVRREVFARDGERCTFVGAEGNRCSATTFLELDHIEPRARGGPSTVANLRVLCRAHNQLAAEDAFGAERVDLHRRKSKRARGALRGTRSATRPHRADSS